ncbi:MAG TPA: ferritin family protein [Thermotogota bacterium]|nr:ferritin family protein [Thermotogota bacterium]HPJ88450.1 ferritin family protein [Thermotogota bacterium]HPR95383.1 ferritin family protein [Thermotogota bacterium]
MELKDLLNVALRIESDGYTTYSRLADENEGKLKELFTHLATQERGHQEKFKKIFETVETDENSVASWAEDDNAGYLMTFAEMSIFPKLSAASNPETLNDAIDLAVEVEKDSIIFYNDLKVYFTDKKIIDEVIAEEKKHLLDLLKSRK